MSPASDMTAPLITTLAEQIGAAVLGDETIRVSALVSLDEAAPDGLSPFFRKGCLDGLTTLPAAVLAEEGLARVALAAGVKGALVHPRPTIALARLIDLFHPAPKQRSGVHPSAEIHISAEIHPTVFIGPLAVVEQNVRIDEGSVIGPRAVICEGARLGARVRIGPGAVIGYEGFGFVPTPEEPVKVRQVGRVVIEDDVEIGANACVDRGTLGATTIGAGTKIDNLVQVGHNGRVGRRVLIAGQAGLAGSVTVGDGALIGGNAGVADHVHVGAGAMLAAKSGVIGDVPDGAVYAGYPAMARSRWLRMVAAALRFAGARAKKQR